MRFLKYKKFFLPGLLVVISLILNLYIAALGPYFHRPHWSSLLFPPMAFIFLTLACYSLGGIAGAILTYLLFSFCFLEIVLGGLTGGISNNLLCALATSGGFHHFKFQLLCWGVTGFFFLIFCRKYFEGNLKKSICFFALSFSIFLINLPFTYFDSDAPIRMAFRPHFKIGYETGHKIVPFSTPFIYANMAYAMRHAAPGVMGDFIAVTAFAKDPGPSHLHKIKHELPEEIRLSPEMAVSNIVFVMGESSTATHYHSYGYSVETTPEIDKILAQGNGCQIAKSHSAANLTMNAVLSSVSLWKPEATDFCMRKINLMELAARNGYTTYWASTENEQSAYSGYIGFIAKYADYFIDSSTEKFHFEGRDFSLKSERDEDLLPIFEAFSQSKTSPDKKFIFLHIWGSHTPYDEKTAKEDTKALPEASYYDQSIHRTDRILSRITQIAQKNLKNPLIIYVSDHGEDPHLVGAGHALAFGGKDYTIPVILIGKQAQKTCHAIEEMRAENGWYSSNMNKFFMMRLLGFEPDKNWMKTEKNPDLVFHIDYNTYPWGKIPKQHLND